MPCTLSCSAVVCARARVFTCGNAGDPYGLQAGALQPPAAFAGCTAAAVEDSLATGEVSKAGPVR